MDGVVQSVSGWPGTLDVLVRFLATAFGVFLGLFLNNLSERSLKKRRQRLVLQRFGDAAKMEFARFNQFLGEQLWLREIAGDTNLLSALRSETSREINKGKSPDQALQVAEGTLRNGDYGIPEPNPGITPTYNVDTPRFESLRHLRNELLGSILLNNALDDFCYEMNHLSAQIDLFCIPTHPRRGTLRRMIVLHILAICDLYDNRIQPAIAAQRGSARLQT